MKFYGEINLALPNIAISPSLTVLQTTISKFSEKIISVSSEIKWWDEKVQTTFQKAIRANDEVNKIKQKIDNATKGIVLKYTFIRSVARVLQAPIVRRENFT